MAMYANVKWSKVSNTAQQPQWAVLQAVWDENGNIVYDEKGQPVLAPIQMSPPPSPVAPPAPPAPATPAQTPVPIVFP